MLSEAARIHRIEEYRPVQISEGAHHNWDESGAEELLGNLFGPDTEAHYTWDDDQVEIAAMAYRYQGCTYVKLVSEPYGHPVNRRDALEHCRDLEEMLTLSDEEGWEEEPNAHLMVRQANLNRGLALAGLHETPTRLIDQTFALLDEAMPEVTRVAAAARQIAQGHAELTRQLTKHYRLERNTLTPEQANAAIEGARRAGAGNAALRDLATRAGMSAEEINTAGIPDATPIPWERAREILEHVFSVTRGDTGVTEQVAATMGWNGRWRRGRTTGSTAERAGALRRQQHWTKPRSDPRWNRPQRAQAGAAH